MRRSHKCGKKGGVTSSPRMGMSGNQEKGCKAGKGRKEKGKRITMRGGGKGKQPKKRRVDAVSEGKEARRSCNYLRGGVGCKIAEKTGKGDLSGESIPGEEILEPATGRNVEMKGGDL